MAGVWIAGAMGDITDPPRMPRFGASCEKPHLSATLVSRLPPRARNPKRPFIAQGSVVWMCPAISYLLREANASSTSRTSAGCPRLRRVPARA